MKVNENNAKVSTCSARSMQMVRTSEPEQRSFFTEDNGGQTKRSSTAFLSDEIDPANCVYVSNLPTTSVLHCMDEIDAAKKCSASELLFFTEQNKIGSFLYLHTFQEPKPLTHILYFFSNFLSI